MSFQQNDGGRALAGYKGQTGDCATRALAIAAQMPYQAAYDLINQVATRERQSSGKRGKSSSRTGVHGVTMRRVMAGLGWQWVPTMLIGQGCKVHLRSDELPMGRLLVCVSKHYVAVIDGVINDTSNPSRDGTRCVYGYFRKGAA
jgi:hypothetical protein